MPRSFFGGLWDAVKPPPAAQRPGSRKKKLRRRQKRLLYGTALVAFLGSLSWGIYSYVAGGPQRADNEYQAGVRLMGPGRYKDAVAQFTRAIKISPQLPNAFLERGISHRYLNENAQAMADFNQAIALNPNLARAYSARGSLFREQGDIRRAVDDFTKSIQIEPNVDAYYERGQTYEDLGEHQKAIDDYNMAISEMRGAPEVYRARSLARRKLGDMDGFTADQQTAYQLEHPR